jgi:hypothetical protein
MVGAKKEVVSWRLGIDGAVDILYNTVIVDWNLERGWIGISVIRAGLASKMLTEIGWHNIDGPTTLTAEQAAVWHNVCFE